jgi:osmotically-inducible protein OsmY
MIKILSQRRQAYNDEATSNASLGSLVQCQFQHSPYVALRKITCSANDGILRITGRVPTFYLKQLAQAIAGSMSGVRQVVNELKVDFPETR